MKNLSKRKIHFIIADIILAFALIIADQISKYLAILKLREQPSISIIDGVFELHYLENRGAAFGLLQDQRYFFVFVAIIITGVVSYVIYRLPDNKKYTILDILLVLIISGALGNMIDRIRQGYVVDFFYFVLIDFPIFNVADIYVTVATFLLIILLLFYYKENDFDFLSIRQQKKYREMK